MLKDRSEFFSFDDLIKACVGTSACMLALFLSWFFHFNHVNSLFILVSAMVIIFATRGVTRKEQWVSFSYYMMFLPVSCLLVIGCYHHLPAVAFYGVVSLLMTGSQILPRYFSSMSVPSITMGIFLVVASSCASMVDKGAWVSYLHLWAVMVLGILITALLSGFFPLRSDAYKEKDQSDYLIKKSVRVGVAIFIGYLVADAFHLLHPSWLLLTILAVSRMSLGASVRRSGYRLAGTFLGFFVAVPLAQSVFLVWHWTQCFALVFLFLFYLLGRLHYILAVFFITLTLGVSYYLYAGGHIASHDAYLFLQDRLLETLVGALIAVLCEVTIFPHSVLCEIRQYTEDYWRLLANTANLLVNFERTKMFALLPKKVKLLEDMKQGLADFRYEPLGGLTLRYHRVVSLVSSIDHLQRRLMRLLRRLDGASVANVTLVMHLIEFMQELEQQYRYSLSDRSMIIAGILDRANIAFESITIQSDRDLFYVCHSFLTVLYRYERVLKTSPFALRWTRFNR